MRSQYEATEIGAGTLMQSGVPKRVLRASGFNRAGGLLLRGVVLNTWVLDDPKHPFASDLNGTPVAVYCDVLCYGPRWRFITNCLVSQEVGGMQRGRVWKPRATGLDKTALPVDPNKGSNPANWDGDHVLVGFIEDNLNQPIILRSIPHPSVDTGNEAKTPGHRMTLKLADGDPDFWKHHGSFYGVKNNGDFVVDTTWANDGSLLPDCKESPNAMDGSGAHLHQLPETATWKVKLMDVGGTIPSVEMTVSKTELKHVIMDALGDLLLQIGGGATLKVEGQDSQAKLTLGDGAKHVAIGEQLQTWWGTVKAVLDAFGAHTHTGVTPGPGLTGTPVAPLITPGYASTNTSTKVAIPDL
jgi:hypothetical protein